MLASLYTILRILMMIEQSHFQTIEIISLLIVKFFPKYQQLNQRQSQ